MAKRQPACETLRVHSVNGLLAPGSAKHYAADGAGNCNIDDDPVLSIRIGLVALITATLAPSRVLAPRM